MSFPHDGFLRCVQGSMRCVEGSLGVYRGSFAGVYRALWIAPHGDVSPAIRGTWSHPLSFCAANPTDDISQKLALQPYCMADSELSRHLKIFTLDCLPFSISDCSTLMRCWSRSRCVYAFLCMCERVCAYIYMRVCVSDCSTLMRCWSRWCYVYSCEREGVHMYACVCLWLQPCRRAPAHGHAVCTHKRESVHIFSHVCERVWLQHRDAFLSMVMLCACVFIVCMYVSR